MHDSIRHRLHYNKQMKAKTISSNVFASDSAATMLTMFCMRIRAMPLQCAYVQSTSTLYNVHYILRKSTHIHYIHIEPCIACTTYIHIYSHLTYIPYSHHTTWMCSAYSCVVWSYTGRFWNPLTLSTEPLSYRINWFDRKLPTDQRKWQLFIRFVAPSTAFGNNCHWTAYGKTYVRFALIMDYVV